MSAPAFVTLQINGKSVQVPAGTSVFEAGVQAGVFIPHYCYHPDLSVAGVCRMCMVEIEKMPRLQISCNTVATEGMVVRTDTDKVKDTVKGVLELHLINHPLDCPICDKAGECKLQDFYRDYGLYESRMEYEKVHKPKVVDIGTIVLDEERCILCTRCVRFTAEVTKTNELGIFNRGDRSELRTYDNGPLRNDYTGNLADICPVGALTAKDFRFKQRVWFLDKTKSTCTLCAHGCSTTVSVNPSTKTLYRVEPRRNPDVNRSWICDNGRWGYHYVGDDSRLKVPKEKRDGVWVDSTWHHFFLGMKDALAEPGEVLACLGTQMTNEEITDVVTTLKEMGVEKFTWVVDETAAAERKPFDGILKHRDLTGNARGFETVMQSLGVKWLRHKDVAALYKGAGPRRALLLGLEGETMPGAAALMALFPKETQVVAHATSPAPWFEACRWALPGVSSYEKSGTIINAAGRLQKLAAAIPWQYTGRDAHAVVWGMKAGNDRTASPADRATFVFEDLLVGRLALGEGMSFRKFPPLGMPLEREAAHVR